MCYGRAVPDPVVLWELRGQTGTPVICSLQVLPSGLVELRVLMGEQPYFSASYRNRVDAARQSLYLRDDLVLHGWAEVYRHGSE